MSHNLNTWNVFWTNQVLMRQSVVGGLQVLLGLWLILRSLQLECARILHKSLLVPVLTYGTETIMWRKKERSRIEGLHYR